MNVDHECIIVIKATAMTTQRKLLLWFVNLLCIWICFGRSGRTSLRKSSFWDSCDTQTQLSTKAATWKTTLPGSVDPSPYPLLVLFSLGLDNVPCSVVPFHFLYYYFLFPVLVFFHSLWLVTSLTLGFSVLYDAARPIQV